MTIVLDLLFTYIATPNLLLEGNPLYSQAGFGWGGLIAINVITFIGYVAMSYYAFIKYKSPVTNETDMKKYLAFINYGDADKYVPMMWKLPKNWGPQTACLCWSVVCVLPFCRMIIVLEWFLMILKIRNAFTVTFFTIVSLFPLGRIDIVLAVIGAWILSFVWIKKEFNKNLKEIEKRKSRI
jgi:uncharacterized integral membrane protein